MYCLGGISCSDRRSYGNCGATWIKAGGFCAATCGICTTLKAVATAGAPAPTCSDIPYTDGESLLMFIWLRTSEHTPCSLHLCYDAFAQITTATHVQCMTRDLNARQADRQTGRQDTCHLKIGFFVRAIALPMR